MADNPRAQCFRKREVFPRFVSMMPAESVPEPHLKSFARKGLWVRPPLPALTLALVVFAAAAAGASSARWSIAHRDGVAWLVTPAGQLFFSIGVNSVDGGGDGDAAYDWTR